jgi:hypothetical protein
MNPWWQVNFNFDDYRRKQTKKAESILMGDPALWL